MHEQRTVVGITGHLGAGRTQVAAILAEEFGLPTIGLSRLIPGNENGDLPLDELQRLGDQLREDEGPSALAQRAAQQMGDEAESFVIDGIKHPAEIEHLASGDDLFVLAVQASPEVRWERVRGRLEDDRSLFNEIDARDNEELDQWGLPVEHGQRVADCIRHADAMIWNDRQFLTSAVGSYGSDDLQTKCVEFYRTLDNPAAVTPLLAEVRMCQAYTVARLSSCPKRKVGAIITSADGESIIAEGRNEVPTGQKSCMGRYDGCFREQKRQEELAALQRLKASCSECGALLSPQLDCPKCDASYAKLLPPRKHLDYCRALHAEERAILQVSQLGGMSLQDSTIFVTTFPCALCAKKIVNCGIGKVVFAEPYNQPEAVDFFKNAGVEVHAFEGFTYRAFERVYGRTQE